MSIEAYRWQMTNPGAPFERVAFNAEAAAGEVVVAIAGCGVCHTDLGYYYDGVRTNASLPLTLGHEISGHVVAAGAGAEGWMGKAVIVPAVLPCGECDLCQRGLQRLRQVYLAVERLRNRVQDGKFAVAPLQYLSIGFVFRLAAHDSTLL